MRPVGELGILFLVLLLLLAPIGFIVLPGVVLELPVRTRELRHGDIGALTRLIGDYKGRDTLLKRKCQHKI